MFKYLMVIILLTINSFVYAADKNFQKDLISQGYISIPIHCALNQNTLLVNFSATNTKQYSFIVDTGSTVTTLDPKVANDLKLKEFKSSVIMGGGDANRYHAPLVIIPIIKYGKFQSNNEIAYLMDKSFIKIDNHPIAGFIGLNFLSNHAAILDLRDNCLYLKINREKPSEITAEKNEDILIADGYKMILLKRSPSKHQILMVSINDAKPIDFMLDSGMPQTTLSLAEVKQLNLKLLSQSVVAKGTGGGQMEIFKVHIAKFFVDPIIWNPPELGAMDFKYIQIGTPIFGVAGLDWMHASHAIFDVSKAVLYIKST